MGNVGWFGLVLYIKMRVISVEFQLRHAKLSINMVNSNKSTELINFVCKLKRELKKMY